MNVEEILEKLKDLVSEWENFECSEHQESDEWCAATEDALWSCAEKLNDLISEVEDGDV